MSQASLKAYQEIRARILSGEFPSGSHLKEEVLAEICGVSRTPIRDALRVLAAEDYVYVKPNHGTFVSEWSSDDINEIFSLRAMLEGFAARLAAEKATPEQISVMEDQVAIIEGMLDREVFDEDSFLKANRVFHDALTQAADSERLITMISRLVEQPVVARTAMSYRIEDLRRSNSHHKELIDAVKARDSRWAESVMNAHILSAYQIYKDHYEEGGAEAS